jgi:hypothetical protein
MTCADRPATQCKIERVEKPDPRLGPLQQDKRSVIPIAFLIGSAAMAANAFS